MATIRRVLTVISGTYVVGGGFATHYFDNDSGTPTQLTTAVYNFWNYNAGIFMTGTTFTVQAEVLSINDANGQPLGVTTGSSASVSGTGTGEAASPATQGLIRWRTGFYEDGKEYRGRTFLPAVPVSQIDDGGPIAAYRTVAQTMATTLATDANSTLVIWRRPRPFRPQVGSPGDRWYLPQQDARDGGNASVISGSPWTKFATLRSRRD